MCDDDAMPLLTRARPVTVVLLLYEMWRRLPPEQRRRLLEVARRNGPRIALSLARRGRARI